MTVMDGEDGDEAEGDRERPSSGAARRRRADAGQDQADRQDHDADLARREADVGHAGALGEAEALGLRPGVADHEGRGERGRRQDGAEVEAGVDAAPGDADVDDALAPAVEDRVHERAELRRLAGRPGEGAVEEVEDAAEDDEDAGEDPDLGGRDDRGDDRDPEADQRQRVRGQPDRPMASAIGVAMPRTRVRRLGRDERSRGGLLAAAPAAPARPRTAAWRAANAVEGLGHEPADASRGRSAASSRGPRRGAGRCATRRAAATGRPGRRARRRSPRPRRGARTIRSRFTSARALWTRRSSRRSSAGRRRTRSSSGCGQALGTGDDLRCTETVGSTTVYINRG